MRVRRATSVLVTLALVGLSLSVASAASATSPTYQISGHVDVGTVGASAGQNQIEVQAYVLETGPHQAYTFATSFAYTDASGAYQMFNLPDATYVLKFSYFGTDTSYVYYQAELDPTASTPVTVADASLTGIDQLVPGLGTIHGHVTTGPDDTSAGAGVNVAFKMCAAPSSTTIADGTICQGLFGTPVQTDADGDFTIPTLQWGKWALQYSDSTHETYTTPASDWVELDPDHLDVTVPDQELLDLGSVTGQVDLGDASRVAGNGDVSVSLWGNSTVALDNVTTDETGTYDLTGVTPGTYKVTFHFVGTDGSFLDESSTSVTVARVPVDLDKTLPAAAIISGTVTDSSGNPVVGFTVAAVNFDGHNGQRFNNIPYTAPETTTDSNGDYVFRDLPPGLTQVTAGNGFTLASHAQDITLAATTVRSDLDLVVYEGANITASITCSSCLKPNSSDLDENFVLQWLNPVSGGWESQAAPMTGGWQYAGSPVELSSAQIPIAPGLPGTYRYTFSGVGQYSQTQTTAPFTVTEGELAALIFTVHKSTILVRTESKNIEPYTLTSTRTFSKGTKITLSANTSGAPKSMASLTWVGDAGDFESHGMHDVAGLSTTGQLWLYPRANTTKFGAPQLLLSGLTGDKVILPGDIDGDGWPDVLVKKPDGTLLLYPGDGSGGLSASSVTIGATGAWKSYNLIVGAYDPNSAGTDLLARSSSGSLWEFFNDGGDTFEPAAKFGVTAKSAASILSVGSISGQGFDDVLADSSSGKLTLYPANHNNDPGTRKAVAITPSIGAGAKLL